MIDDAIIDKVSWPGLDNAAAFEAAHNSVMDFVYKSLRLDGDTKKPQPKSEMAAIDSFRHIGEILCEKYTLAQRQGFYDSCKMTTYGYRTEQRLRVAGRLPTREEYWSYREGSSCISMCVAMIELAINSHLPAYILQSQEIQLLWRETRIGSWLVNDILSSKKEMGEGSIENAVALGAIETPNAQDGMDRTVQLVKESTARFEEQVKEVEKKFGIPDDSSVREGDDSVGLKEFVVSCKCIITGSLAWR